MQGPAGRGPGRRVPRLEVAGELAAAAGGGERGHPVTPRHWTGEGDSSIVTSAAVIPEAVLRVLLSKLSLKSWSSARSSMGRSSPLVMMMGTLLPPALCSGHWALEEAQTGVQCQTAAPASVFAQFNPVWRSGSLASRGRTARLAQHRLQICKVG